MKKLKRTISFAVILSMLLWMHGLSYPLEQKTTIKNVNNATVKPTLKPTAKPTPKPTVKPAAKPTPKPTTKPTAKPTAKPVTQATPKPVATPLINQADKKSTESPTLKFTQQTVNVFSGKSAQASIDGNFEIGDYLFFGTYHQDPILWRVIHKDSEKGLLLWSEKLLTIKPYDSTGNKDADPKSERFRVGSNFWGRSTLRDWLNSDALKVTFTHYPPDDVHVWLGHNDYAEAPGFLYGFSQEEKSLINKTSQKSILSEKDLAFKEGGTTYYDFQGSRNPKTSVKNYEQAYFHRVSDKIFLLDIKQIADYVSARGFEFKKSPTQDAVEDSEFKQEELAADKNYMYWIRTPAGKSDSGLLRVSADGVIGEVIPDNRNLGVAPALYLQSKVNILSGKGSLAEPFTVGLQSNGYVAPKREKLGSEQGNDPVKVTVEVKKTPSDPKTLNTLSAWAKESADYLKKQKILNEASFTQYKKNLTRGETAYFTVRLYEHLTGKSLSDVSVNLNHLFKDTNEAYVRKAFYVGIMNGYANGNFGVKDELTREQMMTVLVKLLGRVGIDLSLIPAQKTVFQDEAAISDWASDGVQKAFAYKIVNGTGEKIISPKLKVTKEEAFVFLYNIIKNKNSLQSKGKKGTFNAILKWAYGGSYDTWTEAALYATPALADLNQDGKMEVVGAASSIVNVDGLSGKLNWRIASGYDITQKNATYQGRTWPDILIQDIDKDGDPEIITAHQKGYVSVYDRKGVFKKGWPQRPTDGEIRALRIADLDLDGKMEIIVGAAVNSAQHVWVYHADGTIRKGWPQLDASLDAATPNIAKSSYTETSFAWGIFNNSIAIGNINSDKYPEIIVPSDVPFINAYDKDGKLLKTNAIFNGRRWGQVGFWESVAMENKLENEGWGLPVKENTPLSERITVNFAHGGSVISDVDGDGINEIIVTGNAYDRKIGHPPGLYIAPFILNADRTRFNKNGFDWNDAPKNTGKPLSEDHTLIENVLPNPVTADMDNDGKQEILFSSYDGRVHCYSLDKSEKNSWPFHVYDPKQSKRTLYEFASVPVVKDIDGDGWKEVIVSTWTEKEADLKGNMTHGRLLILNYKGELERALELPFPIGTNFSNGAMAAPLVADIDKDGEYEVVLNTSYSGLVAYDLAGSKVKE